MEAKEKACSYPVGKKTTTWGSGRMAVVFFTAESRQLINDQQLDVADVSVGGACFIQGSYHLKEVVGVVVF